MTEQFLIVGLGNPGKKYANNRHNFGFRVVDALAQRHGMMLAKKEKNALTASGIINGHKVLLAQPQTYMNNSGQAVRGLVDFYKLSLENLLVISDDLDIPLGTIRLRRGGGPGGQNGLRSIIQHLGTRDFNRLRLGIGRPPGKMEASNYVLTDFEGDDAILAQEVVDRAVLAVEAWLADGIDLTMTRFNGTIDKPVPPKKIEQQPLEQEEVDEL
ncbi:MAG: aminoacyl-tRNA hydrolase [Chloroflexi bacterium]|nr:MAG: aminoacyl-tRNA hydrolase [Phototrophicales bacterium]RMF81397.1 MAG: aminoacyl-tRNA hydrolase [Chloroflexota bacterium]